MGRDRGEAPLRSDRRRVLRGRADPRGYPQFEHPGPTVFTGYGMLIELHRSGLPSGQPAVGELLCDEEVQKEVVLLVLRGIADVLHADLRAVLERYLLPVAVKGLVEQRELAGLARDVGEQPHVPAIQLRRQPRAMAICAYDSDAQLVKRIDRGGARYIYSTSVDEQRQLVSFVGQSRATIEVSFDDLHD